MCVLFTLFHYYHEGESYNGWFIHTVLMSIELEVSAVVERIIISFRLNKKEQQH